MKKKATVICWISTALAALALCLTCGLPLPAGIPPMLLQWLILPLLALLAAAVQAGRLLAGLRAALAGKPDGRLFCLLAAIGALALAAIGKGGSSAAAAALLLCADAWLEQLQARVDGELPGTRLSSAGARLWFWGFLLAAVCAAVVWGILGAAADEIVCRAVGILAVGALCPFSLTAACTVRRAVRICRVPVLDARAVPALGDTDIVLLEPEGLLTSAPSVSDIRPAGMEEGQFLALAASILQGSGDGQAVCIRALAEDRGLALRPAAQADAAGAVIDGKHYLTGTAEQLRRGNEALYRATLGKSRLAYVPDAEKTELQALEEVGWRCLTPSMDRSDYKLESSSNASALMKRVSARRGDVSVWLGTTASAAGLREFVISAQGAGHYCRAMTEIG